ncbi:YoaK family protein [Streptomyces griseoluteus]|uniref:YoaK family protein n=1 Tax=Streptomyces griseoluteus TaxID=29306 RepID=UPI0036FECAB3
MTSRASGGTVEQRVESKSGSGRSLRIAVVLLVAASGALESVSFLGLERVFAGVMTSNLALLGMAVGRGKAVGVAAAVLALAGFGLGVLVGSWCTRGSAMAATRWPRSVVIVLAAEAVLLAVGALVWGLTDGMPGETTRYVMQFGAGLAMGAQSAAMVTAGHAAAPTTYLTGTLATYIVKGVHSGRPGVWVPLRFAGLVAGAALSATLLKEARAWAALPPLVLMLCALAVARAPLPARRYGFVGRS